MTDPTNTKAQEIVQWAPVASPVTVEYSLGLMAQIRDHVIVGFHRLAKRGIECGGILYGRREGRQVSIEQIREIRCEYKLGPSFVLSDSDRFRLAAQLHEPEPELEGLVPVGLYVSHTKDDLRATERDLTVYDSYFSEPWHVLLILRPARQGSVRAGFFVRESTGELRGDRSYEEFELDPPDSPAEAAALMAAARMPLDGGSPSPIDQHPQYAFAASRSGAAAAPALARDHFSAGFHPAPAPGAPSWPKPIEPDDPGRALVYPPGGRYDRQVAPAYQVRESVETLRQRFQQPGVAWNGAPREKHWSWLFLWGAGIVLLAVATYFVLTVRSPAPLLLRIAEQSGDLRVEWDRASASIQRASSGTLEIREGARTRDFRLSPEQLAAGSYLYPITGGDVSVRLSVTGMLIPRVEESVNFVAEAKPGVDSNRLTQENRGLKDELKREREANERLEQRLRALEERLQPAAGRPNKQQRRRTDLPE
jgi:hypothetical protein